MHSLTFVKGQECTLEQFLNGPLYDPNFDTSGLAATYSGGKQVRVGCNVGFSGFFEMVCIEGKWESRGTICNQVLGCSTAPIIANGDLKYTRKSNNSHNEMVEYMCQAYYTMEGEPYKTCFNGVWTGHMRCITTKLSSQANRVGYIYNPVP
ncbi:hypothetical protein NQZ68_004882 [Dissostichus eleginoides]|nr:hypothetical protein NQZ68_004882 [Dissostichus eleginoides]